MTIRIEKETQKLKNLYTHILKEQIMELKVFIPSSVVFNILAVWVILYVNPSAHLVLILFQAIFGLVFLLNSVHSFKVRSKLLTS